MTLSPAISPQFLGLPPKFPNWRPGQWDAIEATYNSSYPYVFNSAPTGFGKSAYYMACAKLEGGRAVAATSTKALQKQLSDDFHSMGLYDVRGRANYPCPEHYNCSDGRLYGCEETDSCPATVARREFLTSPLSVTNYDYILSSNIHGEGVGKIDLLILDEAHAAVQELSDAIEIHLVHHKYQILYRHFNAPPPQVQDLEHFRAWAKGLKPAVVKYRDTIKESGDRKILGVTTSFAQVLDRIETVPSDWIIDLTRAGEVVIAPLWPADFFLKYLANPATVSRVLFTSATLVPKTRDLLGVPADKSIFLNQDYAFDPRRSPAYLFGPHWVTHKNTDAQKMIWLSKMDTVISHRLDRKGIIHTHSYDRQAEIMSRSEFSRYMIAPRNAGEVARAIAEFKASAPPRYLISPSVTTGYDFPGSECEFQIISKMPFIDSRGPIMEARTKADPEYLPYLTAQILVQMCGRAMRGPDDRCENFIMDAAANTFTAESTRKKGGYRHLLPSWFSRQLSYPDGFPVPPPPMYWAA